MKYSYLQKWTSEQDCKSKVVEKVHYANAELQICFSDDSVLRFIQLDNEIFPLWDKLPRNSKSNPIWRQLEQSNCSGITISDKDRIIYISFEAKDIYNQRSKFMVVAECILPQPNLILCKASSTDLLIIEAINKYSFADNPQRQILPNLPYFSPITSYRPEHEDICYPLILNDFESNTPLSASSMNAYFWIYLKHFLLPRRSANLRKQQHQKWLKENQKLQKKLRKQQQELLEAEKSEYWHTIAETLKHNLHNIQPGQLNISAINYYDPDMAEISIPLFADKSPKDNLKYYLKKYQKAKKGYEVILANIQKTNEEIALTEDILTRIANNEDVSIYEDDSKNSGKIREKLSKIDKLLRIIISEDWEILIGKKATENDLITTQIGKPADWWFHTRIYHGSHILLRNFRKQEPPPELIEICCSLAAWYSKAKFSDNVPVDYTQIRFVRKPRKSAPGFVTYSTHNTVFATPKDLRTIKIEHNL